MARIRLCLVGAIALVAVSCQDHGLPTAARPPISAEFRDAGHGRGNPHFYLLSPLVSRPDLTKETFESGLLPSVRITEQPNVAGVPKFAGCTNDEPIDYLPAAEFTRLQAYAIFWRPSNYPGKVTPPCIYRLQVELFGTTSNPVVLGFADVQVISKTTIKNLQTGQYIPLPKDLTLPFWFFIGQGAVFFAQTGGTDACRPDRDCVEAVVSRNTENTILTKNKGAGIRIPAEAFDKQITLVIEEQTERPCIPPGNLGLPQFSANKTGCYRYQRYPSDAVLSKDLTVAMCVDIGLEPVDHAQRDMIKRKLQIFRFEPREVGVAQALANTPASFLPCEEGRFVLGRFDARALLNGLSALFGPPPLHAATSVALIHLGVGGVCTARRCLSAPLFTWGIAGTVTKNSADPQTALPGTPVAVPPSVLVMDLGDPADEIPVPQPIANATVTFRVIEGGGSIAAPGGVGEMVPVTTDGSGIATLGSWTLGATPGTNRVWAVVGGTVDTVTFTATGVQTTTTSLSTSAPLAEVGSTISLTATVSPAPTVAESPVVEFFDGETSLGTSSVVAGGVATLNTSSLVLAEHSLSARFLGTSSFTSSTSGTLAQQMVQRFSNLAAFNAALGGAPVATQDFESIAVGTAISTIISGVLDVTSTFDVLQVSSGSACNCLFGFDNHTRAAGHGSYGLRFVATRDALAFEVEGQNPATGPAHVEVHTAGGSVTFSVSNTTNSELNPVFVGMIASQPLQSVTVNEGVEVGGLGSEEIALDDFSVALVTVP